MRFLGSLATALFIAAAAIGFSAADNASADEYFIPKGQVYSLDTNHLAPQSPRSAEIEAQTDIIETELYRKNQEKRAFYEHFRTFRELDLFHSGRSYSDY